MPMRFALTMVTVLACLAPSAHAADTVYLLKPGHLLCPANKKTTLAKLADADAGKSDKAYEAAVKEAIYTGACSGGGDFYLPIKAPSYLRTKAGNRYACFEQQIVPDDDGDVDASAKGETYCTLIQFLTSVQDEFEARSGGYDLVQDDEFMARAKCREGGTVMLYKGDQTWTRTSTIFPLPRAEAGREVAADLPKALRDGCRGADYAE
jgi:hypothetical protein